MTTLTMKRFGLGAVLLAGTIAAGSAAAQSYPVQSYRGPAATSYREDASSALARHIRTLASSPKNVSALLGAGNAALEVGDVQAALAFFARAEEVAPRDGRIKAGMGSAFVQTEQPQAALKFFADAIALGAPANLVAKDRGLAHDMVGNPAQAQADYTLALQNGTDAEVERRLALSRAISGDRDGALAVLDTQLRRQDRGGWRARAFVLALTGDTAGAMSAVAAAMPGPKAGEMQPFLARLPQLSDADQAMAVHFGRFPKNAQVAAVVPHPQYVPPPANMNRVSSAQGSAASSSMAGSRGQPAQPARAREQPFQTQRQSQPLQTRSVQAQEPDRASPRLVLPSVDIRAPLRERMEDAAARAERRTPEPSVTAEPSRMAALQPISVPTQFPESTPPPAVQSSVELPAESVPMQALATVELQPSAAALTEPGRPDVQSDTSIDFADVAAAIAALPSADSVEIGSPDEPQEAKPVATKPAPAKKVAPAPPKEPGRIWVQLAAAQDKKAFPAEFRRIQSKAGAVLGDKTAWTTPLRTTNRLLVGPFKTDKEARDLVNALSKAQISSYSWTSEAGQAVEKLPAK